MTLSALNNGSAEDNIHFIDLTNQDRKRNRRRDRGYARNSMMDMDAKEFKKMFRMSKEVFETLLEHISPFLHDTNLEEAERSSGSMIDKRTKLAVTLRWLAGGSYWDICLAFGVASGSFFNETTGPLWPTMHAINNSFKIGFPFKNEEQLKEMAEAFSQCSQGQMEHCVLAIDGWVMKTRAPFSNEVLFPSAYRNRHMCFGIVILAVCGANLKF